MLSGESSCYEVVCTRILCRAPDDERLDSFETCRADKNCGIKTDYKNWVSGWLLPHCNMMHGTHVTLTHCNMKHGTYSVRLFHFQDMRTGPEVHLTLFTVDSGVLFVGGREADHLLPTCVKVENDWSYASSLPVCFHGSKKGGLNYYHLTNIDCLVNCRNGILFSKYTSENCHYL